VESTTRKIGSSRTWQQKYAGALASEAGGTPLLEDGMTFIPASQTAKDLQYIESRKLTDEEVTRSYHIPPPMIGILITRRSRTSKSSTGCCTRTPSGRG
jgi:phage portal protein BeeE